MSKCLRCGQCCKDVMISTSPKGLREGYNKWRKGKNDYIKDVDLIYPMLIFKFYSSKDKRYHYECKHLKFKNKKAMCSIEQFKPEMCSGFPYYIRKLKMTLDVEKPSQYKNCGYNQC